MVWLATGARNKRGGDGQSERLRLQVGSGRAQQAAGGSGRSRAQDAGGRRAQWRVQQAGRCSSSGRSPMRPIFMPARARARSALCAPGPGVLVLLPPVARSLMWRALMPSSCFGWWCGLLRIGVGVADEWRSRAASWRAQIAQRRAALQRRSAAAPQRGRSLSADCSLQALTSLAPMHAMVLFHRVPPQAGGAVCVKYAKRRAHCSACAPQHLIHSASACSSQLHPHPCIPPPMRATDPSAPCSARPRPARQASPRRATTRRGRP